MTKYTLFIIFIFAVFISCSKDEESRNTDAGITMLQGRYYLPFVGFSIKYGDTIQYPNRDDIIPDFMITTDLTIRFYNIDQNIPIDFCLFGNYTNASSAELCYDTIKIPGINQGYPPEIKLNQVYTITSSEGESIKLLILDVEQSFNTINGYRYPDNIVKFKWERLKP